jgi:dienelactone hydrolase
MDAAPIRLRIRAATSLVFLDDDRTSEPVKERTVHQVRWNASGRIWTLKWYESMNVRVDTSSQGLELLVALRPAKTYGRGEKAYLDVRIVEWVDGVKTDRLEAILAADKIGQQVSALTRASHQRWLNEMPHSERWRHARERLKRDLRDHIGLPDAAGPLRVRALRSVERETYRIETLVFDARPGVPVTANVFVPKGKGPFPAVLHSMGHYPEGRMEPHIQRIVSQLARLGFVSMSFDLFGMGERKGRGNRHGLGEKALNVGRTNLSFSLVESMRALTYLTERPDVDKERVGVTGHSGGGLSTLLLAALDDRVRAAAPAGYVATRAETLRSRALAYCICDYIPGLAQLADTADILALIAPRPVLVIASDEDPIYSIEGAQAAVSDARPAFVTLGASDNLESFSAPGKHEFTQPMREAMYGFFVRNLQPQPKARLPIREQPTPLETAEVLFRVPKEEEQDSIQTELEQISARLERARPSVPDTNDLAAVLHWKEAKDRVLPLTPSKEGFLTADGYSLPIRVLNPKDATGPTALVIHPDGISAGEAAPEVRVLLNDGVRLIFAELRHTGAAASHLHFRKAFVIHTGALDSIPLVSLRAADLEGLRQELGAQWVVAYSIPLSVVGLVASWLGGFEGLVADFPSRQSISSENAPAATVFGIEAFTDFPGLAEANPRPSWYRRKSSASLEQWLSTHKSARTGATR